MTSPTPSLFYLRKNFMKKEFEAIAIQASISIQKAPKFHARQVIMKELILSDRSEFYLTCALVFFGIILTTLGEAIYMGWISLELHILYLIAGLGFILSPLVWVYLGRNPNVSSN